MDLSDCEIILCFVVEFSFSLAQVLKNKIKGDNI